MTYPEKIHVNMSKIELYIAFLLGAVIIYFPRICYILPNPDAIWNSTVYKTGYAWEVSLGRYLIALLQALHGNVVSPSFVTIISLIFMAMICMFMVDVLDIRGWMWQFLAGMLLILSPHTGSVLTYYYCSDMYLLSYLLSVLAVWVLVKNHSGWMIYISMLLLMGSLAIYQAYLGVTIVLCFLYLLLMILDARFSVIDIIRQTARFLSSGTGGIILYLLSNRLIQNLFNISATENRGFAAMGLLDLQEIPVLLRNCYRFFYHYFFSDIMLCNSSGGRRVINIIYWLLCLILCLAFLKGKRLTIWKKVVCACLAVLLPLTFMSIVVIAPEVSILDTTGVLMLPAMNYAYVLIIFLLQRLDLPRKHLKFFLHTAVFSCCIAIAWMLLILELAGQTYMRYNMMKTDFVAGQISTMVEMYVDNSENYRICIVGDMESGNYPEQYPELRENVKWTSSYYKTIWPGFGATQACWACYFRDFCGKNYYFASQDDYKKILDSNLLETMSDFPDMGSMVVKDDLIIIRLSEASWQ